jgi:hypothetical protein
MANSCHASNLTVRSIDTRLNVLLPRGQAHISKRQSCGSYVAARTWTDQPLTAVLLLLTDRSYLKGTLKNSLVLTFPSWDEHLLDQDTWLLMHIEPSRLQAQEVTLQLMIDSIARLTCAVGTWSQRLQL